jgi:uncharacterized protein YndB with AHSA1/START domain
MSTQRKIGETTFTMAGDREIVATRVLDAPRRLVWKAWTEPELVSRWMLGPEGWSMPVCELDLRVGGRWRFVWRKPGDGEFGMVGEYREIAPPERLVSTESWGGDWAETLNTVVLTEANGRTTITCTVLYPSREDRERALQTGMLDGWSISYDRLGERLLAMHSIDA